MSLIRRGIGSHKFRVEAGLSVIVFLFFFFSFLALNSLYSHSLAEANITKQYDSVNIKNETKKNMKQSDNKKNTDKPKQPVKKLTNSVAITTPVAPLNINAKAGVYNGPGAVASHKNFEQWLGKPVPYATDYIDYKGGWQKDFVDSKVWLIKPWSEWVKAGQGRRLVLGLPMLENENNQQFSQGVNGANDQYFRVLSTDLISNGLGNSIIRLGYEANCDTIGPWQATNNPEGYRQLFRHIVAVMRSVPGSNFSFDWTVCNGLQNGKQLNSFDSFYPGDDVVDIMGMDIYDVKWQDPSATPQSRWQHLATRKLGIDEFIKFAHNHGKTVSYPEWGLYKPGDNFAGGGDNTYFINKMAELISSTQPHYQSYFNLDWGGGVLNDFPSGKSAYKNIFGE